MTLYIKGEQSTEVKTPDVTLGDLVMMECVQTHIVSRLRCEKIMKMPEAGKHRYVISILKIIERIHEIYPQLEIQNMGAADIVVTYEKIKKKSAFMEGVKVILVCLLTFVGAAFAIMTFNNDSGTAKLFEQIYELFMGKPKEGFSILELSYSIGLTVGIVIFFNHLGRKKITSDPTPIQIEMRLYEDDIQKTIIEESSRRGTEADVSNASNTGGHRA